MTRSDLRSMLQCYAFAVDVRGASPARPVDDPADDSTAATEATE